MRARPRAPESQPFKHHERPKWWHEAERKCIQKRCRVGPDGYGSSTIDALLRWNYGERTPDEVLWFGPGGKPALDVLFKPLPFWEKIKKEPLQPAPVLSVPVVFGSGWRR